MFEEAEARARFLDDYLAKEGKPYGPLHGLPVSIKDHYLVKGTKTTVGFVSWLDNPADNVNSPIVEMLLDLGAVLYVKTNIPQTMMTADSENNIFGRVLNPHNTSLTAGGSSGGEGALIALRGSLLGIGSDIGGSVRIPALCCGIYGFKPTLDRLPMMHNNASVVPDGLPFAIRGCCGPMASSLDGIELSMENLLGLDAWRYDSSACSSPWRRQSPASPTKPLTIGVLPEDPPYPLHPPVKRALSDATAALKAAGHTIVHLPYDSSTSCETACRIGWESFMIDPTQAVRGHIEQGGEPFINSLIIQPKPLGLGIPRGKDIAGLAAINVDIANFRESWRQVWVKHDLDVVLGPGAQNTAVPHDTYHMPPYTLVWNVLNVGSCSKHGKLMLTANSSIQHA